MQLSMDPRKRIMMGQEHGGVWVWEWVIEVIAKCRSETFSALNDVSFEISLPERKKHGSI